LAKLIPVLVALLAWEGAGFCQAPPEASTPAGQTIVMVDAVAFITAGVPKTVNERERFFADLRKKLADHGWTTTVRPAEPECGTGKECLAHVQAATGADYVVGVSGEGNLLRGYTLHLQLYSAITHHVQQAAAFCDLCATDRIAGIAAEFAVGLLTDTIREEQALRLESRHVSTPAILSPAPPPLQPAQPPALAPALAGANPAPDDITPAEARASPHRAQSDGLAWLSWGLMGAGAASAAYGGWALYQNGRYAGTTQVDASLTLVRDRYASGAVGATALAVGAGLALVGVLLRISDPPSRAESPPARPVALSASALP
jgi:hypothetical protein